MYYREHGNKVRFFVNCGIDSNGKKIIKSKQVSLPAGLPKKKRKQMIQEIGEEYEKRIKGGSSRDNDKLKFKDFVKGIYETNHLSSLKPKTAEMYRRVIKERLIGYFGEMQLQDITALDIRKWISQLDRMDGQSKDLSANSKGNWFRTLSAILGKAEEWELITINPCRKVKQPRKPQSDVKALSQEDVIKVFRSFNDCKDPRLVILMKLLLLTGIRASECCGLEWRDIDYENCSIKIERETMYLQDGGYVETTPKSQSSRRSVFVPKSFCDDLKRYRELQLKDISDRGPLWIGEKGDKCKIMTQFNGLPVSCFTINHWVQKYLKWCGVPVISTHGLRHTFASLLIANGVDVRTTAAQMGHSQPSLVFNTYANPQDSAKRKAAILLDSILSQGASNVEDSQSQGIPDGNGNQQQELSDEDDIQSQDELGDENIIRM